MKLILTLIVACCVSASLNAQIPTSTPAPAKAAPAPAKAAPAPAKAAAPVARTAPAQLRTTPSVETSSRTAANMQKAHNRVIDALPATPPQYKTTQTTAAIEAKKANDFEKAHPYRYKSKTKKVVVPPPGQ